MDISIVVACRNAAATLEEALDSLAEQHCEYSWEIVLADNGSRDGSREIFERFAAAHPRLAMRVIDASAKVGKPYALNLAIDTSASRWFLFCDADDRVAPDWLAAMARALEAHPFVAARMDVTSMNPEPLRIGRSKSQEQGLARLRFAPFCVYAGGATLGFHRSVFDAVGGFDPVFAALEDTDFCIRAHLAGFELRFVPDAVYMYRFRDTPDAIWRQAYAYNKYRALLRRRYDRAAGFDAVAWGELLKTLARLLAWRVGRPLLKGALEGTQRVWFSRKWGSALGQLAGALRYRVSPPRPLAPEPPLMLRTG